MHILLKNFKSLNLYEWILMLYPFTLFKSTIINIFLFLTSCIFLYEIFKKKKITFLNMTWLYFYIIFFFYNVLNSFFATDYLNALQSSIFQFKFLFFSLFIFTCIPNCKNLDFIIKIWAILLLLVSLDGIYQYFFFTDIFNFPRGETRITGPFGTRAVIGGYLTIIGIPIIFYYFSKFNNYNLSKKIILLTLYLILFFTVVLSGERLSLIIFLSSTIIIFAFYTNIKKLLTFLVFSIFTLYLTFILSSVFNNRINDLINILSNFYTSSYGRLYESSFLLFQKHLFFGVGFKNYRVDCLAQFDPRPESRFQFCSTHPHNLYLELLSESGIIGFFLFILVFYYFFSYVIRQIKKNKNKKTFNQFSSLMYGHLLVIFIYLFPLKTSGSFFTTYNASFFWFSLGFVLLILKRKSVN